jgi:hypothetical protein
MSAHVSDRLNRWLAMRRLDAAQERRYNLASAAGLVFGVLLEVIENCAALRIGQRRHPGLLHPCLHRLHLHFPHRCSQRGRVIRRMTLATARSIKTGAIPLSVGQISMACRNQDAQPGQEEHACAGKAQDFTHPPI